MEAKSLDNFLRAWFNRGRAFHEHIGFYIVLIFILSSLSLFLLAYSPTLELEKKPEKFGLNLSKGEMLIPAVDKEGKGVISKLVVEARPGKGRILVNIDNLLYWVDTQVSIKQATQLAQKFLQSDISQVDLIYTIEANASLVGGPSAGAALTLATIASLTNVSLNKKVMITGAINENGDILPVGGILEKAKAARSAGIEKFLVPQGQSKVRIPSKMEKCEKIGLMTICSIEFMYEEKELAEEVGMEVVEVKNIWEAWKHFHAS